MQPRFLLGPPSRALVLLCCVASTGIAVPQDRSAFPSVSVPAPRICVDALKLAVPYLIMKKQSLEGHHWQVFPPWDRKELGMRAAGGFSKGDPRRWSQRGLGGEFRMGGKSVECHGGVSSGAGGWEHMTFLGSFSSFSSILWQVALRTFLGGGCRFLLPQVPCYKATDKKLHQQTEK